MSSISLVALLILLVVIVSIFIRLFLNYIKAQQFDSKRVYNDGNNQQVDFSSQKAKNQTELSTTAKKILEFESQYDATKDFSIFVNPDQFEKDKVNEADSIEASGSTQEKNSN
jgi:hypothetical protein